MPRAKQQSATPLRMPEDLKVWLKARAESNLRSLNAEIIAMLLEERRKDQAAGVSSAGEPAR